MKLLRVFLILLALASLCIAAQTTGRRRGRQLPKSAAASPPAIPPGDPPAPSPPKAPVTLAIVNGQEITMADIDPGVRQEVDSLDQRIVELRNQVLDTQINTILIEIEARRRRVTSQQLYELEVERRIGKPTDGQIQKVIEENRDRLGDVDQSNLRDNASALWHDLRVDDLSQQLIKRLKLSYRVTMGSNLDVSRLAPNAIVATVGGLPIAAGGLNEQLKPLIYKLRLSTYELQKSALDRTIKDLLLLAEAKRRNIGPEEIVRAEVTDKIMPPTDAEVTNFYNENKDRMKGDLESIRHYIVDYLQDQEHLHLEQQLNERLRQGANIRELISEPQPPVQVISTDDDPSMGDPNAPVTIVEFTDFQCPACAAMHPIIKEVMQTHGKKARVVFRDFPLLAHPNARKAAEAANAARAQGKFLEYIDLLYKRQNALDVPSLKKYAAEIGLNQARFDAALDSSSNSAEVQHDVVDGQFYGVTGTPTIFVDGVLLRTLSADGLRAAIDNAYAKKQKATKQ